MKKNRSTLKDYFKKGAIPTESNFADLIDSMLNQEEDNISKLPNDPLKITAIGVDEALVNFYRVENNAEQLSWQVKQKMAGIAGLSISDTAASRLFIQNGTGNLGVGMTAPAAKLHIVGSQDHVSLRVGLGDAGGGDFTMDVAAGQGLVSLVAGAKINPDGGGYTFLGGRGASKITLHDGRIKFHTSNSTAGTAGADATGLTDEKMTFTNDGRLGIGTTSPGAKLHVGAGQILVDGNQKIFFSDTDTTNNLKLQLYTGYGLGINNSTLFYAANGQHSWRDASGANERMLLTTAATGALTVKGTGASSFAGSLTIGSNTPGTYKLNVTGNALITGDYLYVSSETAGRLRVGAAWNIPGLYSGDDGAKDLILGVPSARKVYLGNGTGDAYIEGGTGNTYVKGNLGLGTTSPKQKLDVQGRINVENGVIQRGGDAITGTSDLGLYSTVDKNYVRLVSTNGAINFYSDGGMGSSVDLSVTKGQVNVTGKLQVDGAQNIIKVKTFTLAVKNKAKDTANTWSVDYTDQKFTEVYAVFVNLQGFSLWGNDANFASWGHVTNNEAIPQHVFARVTASDTKTASGTSYCSESKADGELDNTVLFTVVVMGRI